VLARVHAVCATLAAEGGWPDGGFREMIDVWGADHGGYIKRVQHSAVR